MKNRNTTTGQRKLHIKFFLLIGLCFLGMEVSGQVLSFRLSGNTIPENEDAGHEIGQLLILEDAEIDVTEDYSFSLAAHQAPNFSFVDNILVSDVSFDHEIDDRYDITVFANHIETGRRHAYSPEFTINVEDVDERPTAVNFTGRFITENNEIGEVIGHLSTWDPDRDEYHFYRFSEETPELIKATFAIDSNRIIAKKHFDYEDRREFALDILSFDPDHHEHPVHRRFFISVDDLEDGRSPTDIILRGGIIDENNEPLVTVGLLSADDQDQGDQHTFRLNNFDDEFIIEGDTLKAAIPLDYEIKRRYHLSITAEDSLGGKLTKITAVNVGNVNDAPREINLGNNNISENNRRLDPIGQLSTEDQDDEEHFYTLTHNPGNRFRIDEENRLVANISFNYEAQRRYPITIQTSDGSLSYEKDFIINIENANDTPTSLGLLNASIGEGNSLGELVGEFYSIDEDQDDNHSYKLVSDPDHGFKIVGNTLIAAKVFEFEQQATYDITVRSNDGNGGITDSDITITIRAENDRVGPTLTSFSPVIGINGVNPVEDVFVATFNEPITYGKGVIEVFELEGNRIIKAYVKPSETFFIQGSQLLISFEEYAGNFGHSQKYYIATDPNAIWDLSGNPLVNPILEGDFSWTFATESRGNGRASNESQQGSENLGTEQAADEERLETPVIIYPNPASESITVEASGSYVIEIIDLAGKVLLQPKNRRNIDISSLSDGTYVIRLQNDTQKEFTYRLVKKN